MLRLSRSRHRRSRSRVVAFSGCRIDRNVNQKSRTRSRQGAMDKSGKVKVGIIGSQFQADIHAASLQIMPEAAELVAVASPTPGNAAAFAKKFGIQRAFTDYREMLKESDIEMITIAAPNS